MILFLRTKFLILTTFFVLQWTPLIGIVDLNEFNENHILENKRIHIPEYPYIFNPSIVRWLDNILMIFRINDAQQKRTNQFGLVWLDENFNPCSQVYLLESRNKSPYLPPNEQDPRFIVYQDNLYIAYNNIIGPVELEMRRIFVAQIQYEKNQFFIENPEILISFDTPAKRMEKNWVPFIWEDKLLLSYSINPHIVLQPTFKNHQCDLIAKTQFSSQWQWGELRGGTPAQLNGEEYLAFFHSYKDMKTIQSKNAKISHYFMGAYTFSGHPPFNITRISSRPIICDDFYEPPYYKTWKPLRVVFPGGFLMDDNFIWIAYGRQDHEVWIAKLDKTQLLNSLVPVESSSN